MDTMQLSLPFEQVEQANFSNFYDENIPWLKAFLDELKEPSLPFFFICGAKHSGKTHLLKALCSYFNEQGKRTNYVALKKMNYLSPLVFENSSFFNLICIDDLEEIIGDDEWELALFSLMKEILHKQNNTILVFSASVKMSSIKFNMPDLQSRFHLCTMYRLPQMTEKQKIQVLIDFAKVRGAVLPNDAATFLLNRFQYDFSEIFKILLSLIAASKHQNRKLSKNFIVEKMTTS